MHHLPTTEASTFFPHDRLYHPQPKHTSHTSSPHISNLLDYSNRNVLVDGTENQNPLASWKSSAARFPGEQVDSRATHITRFTPSSPLYDLSTAYFAHGSGPVAVTDAAFCDWQMYTAPYSNSMGGAAASQSKNIKRTRVHQRTPSASTIASNGPASPFMHNTAHPYIVNGERDPNTLAHCTDQTFFSKNLPTPSQTPAESGLNNYNFQQSQTQHMPNAHLAMKGFAIDYHHSDDYSSDIPPSRRSMSSYGNDSPATPQSGLGEVDTRSYGMSAHGKPDSDSETVSDLDCLFIDEADLRPNNPHVQLFRTESQAFQDELYNPNAIYAPRSSAPKTNPSLLSPHRNQLSERLQTANLARSASPSAAVSREKSPFREGFLNAPNTEWTSSLPATAADMRKQDKERSAQAEYAQHRAPLRREPTKTISPKETFLDCNDTDQVSLFHDNVPAGYKAHTTGPQQWQGNQFISQPEASYCNLPTSDHELNFRNTATPMHYAMPSFDFANILPPGDAPNTQFPAHYQGAGQHKMNGFPPVPDHTPDFPAQLPSMETSISDVGPALSSQETDITSSPQRPDDTRANTGTYTCTYHGCTHRFDSHNALQKHKRDVHRSQQQYRDATSLSAAGSVSPRSSGSPASSGTGMTSTALLARNSQSGPHKCTRINPSTNKPCNTIFSRPYDLTRHEDTIHNNRKQKVRCTLCPEEKTFSRNDALTRHMRVVHPEMENFGKRSRRGD